MTQTLPTFEAKPLIKTPVPMVGFLGGERGKAVDEEVKGIYKDFFVVTSATDYVDGIIQRSNPFYVVAVNEVIKQEGLRTATPADLEKILKLNTLDLRGHYEASALVLRKTDEPNSYLARHLMEQVKERNEQAEMPVMIPLNGLELGQDSWSPHSLVFNLGEDAQIIYAPQLNHENNRRRFSETNENGLPVFDEKGDRILYTRNSGLSGLILNMYLTLCSDWHSLVGSNVDGRVAVVSGEASRAEK